MQRRHPQTHPFPISKHCWLKAPQTTMFLKHYRDTIWNWAIYVILVSSAIVPYLSVVIYCIVCIICSRMITTTFFFFFCRRRKYLPNSIVHGHMHVLLSFEIQSISVSVGFVPQLQKMVPGPNLYIPFCTICSYYHFSYSN